MNILSLICARGNSKGLKNKNILNFNGKPLIANTIHQAKNIKIINKVVVSTDSLKIAKISEKFGADVPFIRPKKYSYDNAPEFEVWRHAIKKIQEQWNNEKTPIVIGGTGLYFKALTDGLVKIPEIPNNLRSEIRKLQKKIGQKKFFSKLIKIDPLVKNFVLPSDSQRSMRAYEVKRFTNKSLFEFTRKTKSNFDKKVFKKIFINIPRELLSRNIEQRVEKMFNDGVVDEVKKFYKMKVNKELSSNKIIGIKEIKDHLQGKITLVKAKGLIMLKTRQYAKRQFTWARGHMKSWEMIYSPNFNDLFKQAINKIS